MSAATAGVPLPTALARADRGWGTTAGLAKAAPASWAAYGCQTRYWLEELDEEPAAPEFPAPPQEPKEREASAPPSAAQVIQGVLDDTGMSVTGLSHVFGVSRQAVYKWLDGGNLQPKHRQKLDELARAVAMLKEARVALWARPLRRRIGGSSSIIDELKKDDGDALGRLREYLPFLTEESEQGRRFEARFGGRRAKPGKFTRFGIPHLRED